MNEPFLRIAGEFRCQTKARQDYGPLAETFNCDGEANWRKANSRSSSRSPAAHRVIMYRFYITSNLEASHQGVKIAVKLGSLKNTALLVTRKKTQCPHYATQLV